MAPSFDLERVHQVLEERLDQPPLQKHPITLRIERRFNESLNRSRTLHELQKQARALASAKCSHENAGQLSNVT